MAKITVALPYSCLYSYPGRFLGDGKAEFSQSVARTIDEINVKVGACSVVSKGPVFSSPAIALMY